MLTGGWGSEPHSGELKDVQTRRSWPLKWGEISSRQTPLLSFLFKFFIKEKRKYMGRCRPWFSSLEKVLSGTVESCS